MILNMKKNCINGINHMEYVLDAIINKQQKDELDVLIAWQKQTKQH